MERYAGQPLGAEPHIAVLGSSKVGNFIVTTPLLRGLKEQYPDSCLDFYGSPVNRDFEQACPWIDWRTDIFPLGAHHLEHLTAVVHERLQAGGYDLVINCDGFNPYTTTLATLLQPRYVAGNALAPNLSEDFPLGDHPWQRLLAEGDWTTPEFLERYRGWLTSNYIGELFCRVAFVETDFFSIRLPILEPEFEVPDLLIHANATRDAKLWPLDRWRAVADWAASQGLSLGLVGTRPKPDQLDALGSRIEAGLAAHPAVTDLRGKTRLIQLAGALTRARACLSVDSGPLHVAVAVGCPTVGICATDAAGVGASPRDLWMPRASHLRLTVSEVSCRGCLDQRFRNDGCTEPEQVCQLGVSVDQVIGLLREVLGAP